jgi:hypothetical protein
VGAGDLSAGSCDLLAEPGDSDLAVSAVQVPADGLAEISCAVRNTGGSPPRPRHARADAQPAEVELMNLLNGEPG